MKRIASILAVAAAIIAFNSCERQEVEELKNNMRIEMKADFDYSKERDYLFLFTYINIF